LKLLIKLLKKDIKIFFDIPNLFLIILSFILIILSSMFEINSFSIEKKYISLEDAIFLTFRGPGNEYTFLQLLMCLLPIITVSFIFGRMNDTELNKGYVYAIYRFGNKQAWLMGKLLFNFLLSGFYYICLYGFSIIIFLFRFSLNGSFSSYLIKSFQMNINILTYLSPLKVVLIMLILNILSCFTVSLFQMFISIITKKSYYGFLFSIILSLVSITSSRINEKISIIFPLNYGIANRFNGITSLGFISYFYYGFFLLTLIFVGNNYIKKNDVFK